MREPQNGASQSARCPGSQPSNSVDQVDDAPGSLPGEEDQQLLEVARTSLVFGLRAAERGPQLAGLLQGQLRVGGQLKLVVPELATRRLVVEFMLALLTSSTT